MDFSLPRDFMFAGVHCGIKKQALDLALIAIPQHSVAVGMYTQNLVRAACIDWNRSITPCQNVQAIVINSGNANACTGKEGEKNNRKMASLAAEALSKKWGVDVNSDQVLTLSTGVIGRQLPMAAVESGIQQAADRLADTTTAFAEAAQAICTTDHTRKVAVREFPSGDRTYRVAAMAKGAGMIGPNMATMLALITCDYPLSASLADQALRVAVNLSFNRISVEGHTSTNDAAILLCPRPAADESTEDPTVAPDFQNALNEACMELALKIPTDGEGASHLIEIHVAGTSSDREADRVARTIALSNLVKTAIAGGDPNWGRIVSAAGYAGVEIKVEQVSLAINGNCVFDAGQPTDFDPAAVSQSIKGQHRTQLDLSVGDGPGQARHWTSDLTIDYVKLNADYTT